MYTLEVPEIDFMISEAYRDLYIEGVVPMPRRAHQHDAGIDLYCIEHVRQDSHLDENYLYPGKSLIIKSGLHINIPPEWMGQVINRSSLLKRGLFIPSNAIDAGYTGEIQIVMFNATSAQIDVLNIIKRLVACAQLVIFPCWTGELNHVFSMPATMRGANGFGSSDKA
jgi:dUTP pyrophosphatase